MSDPPARRRGVRELISAATAGVDEVSCLKVLDLSFNDLETLEDDESTPETTNHTTLADLVSLQDLRLNDNRLTTLCSTSTQVLWDRLAELRVQNNCIDSLAGVEKFRKLQTLRIDGNPLKQPLSLATLPFSLSRLNISRCQITSLDSLASSNAARRLEEIRLDGNALKSLDALKNCSKLVELHLADCDLTPMHLKGLNALAPTLETLVLDGNLKLCRDVNAKKTFALHSSPRLPKLLELSVARCGAETIGAIGNNSSSTTNKWHLASSFPSLERLDVSENEIVQLDSLKSVLAKCVKLTELRLTGNPVCTQDIDKYVDKCADTDVDTDIGISPSSSYRRSVIAVIPSVLYLDDVAVSDVDRDANVTPAEQATRRAKDLAELKITKNEGTSHNGAASDSDDVSYVSDVSDVSEMSDVARARDGAAFQENNSTSPSQKSTTSADVANEFRVAMLQHDFAMRESLARVRQALAATSSEAAAALREDGSFLEQGDALPSKKMPQVPKLGTIYTSTRAGMYDPQREEDAVVAAAAAQRAKEALGVRVADAKKKTKK